MNLILEIEFLTGVCRAAREPGDNKPDWPPQPDRVFSALVSAWGVWGEAPDKNERAALEWLEEQPSPVIWSSECSIRTAPDVYVPPNDLKKSSAKDTYLKILPDRRPRQPRHFPVARPHDPKVELVWTDVPETEVLGALNALASRVGYVGHSASLARCRFFVGNATKSQQRQQRTPRRRIYPGRLRELEQAHNTKPQRPVISAGSPVVPVNAPSAAESSAQWLVLEAIEDWVPDIRSSALVCRLLRQAIMAGYGRSGRGDTIPESVSGHNPDGTPTQHSHLSIVPMAFVGSPHADGRVFGFALIPPRGEPLNRMDGFLAAWKAVAHYCDREQRRVLTLQGPSLKWPLRLAPAPNDGGGRRSLLPGPYLKKSSRWATVTPIVLDRHLKRKDEFEIREIVACACENAGLPRPKTERIQVGKHSAVEGVPSARPLAGAPPWTRWKLPKLLRTRWLTHAVIDFDEPVDGPVLLGAGRFTGLGLCRGVEG